MKLAQLMALMSNLDPGGGGMIGGQGRAGGGMQRHGIPYPPPPPQGGLSAYGPRFIGPLQPSTPLFNPLAALNPNQVRDDRWKAKQRQFNNLVEFVSTNGQGYRPPAGWIDPMAQRTGPGPTRF